MRQMFRALRTQQQPSRNFPTQDALLRRWHKMLNLRHQSPPSWYQDRLDEEILEVSAATSRVEVLSETSDVLFSIIRARYDGFPVQEPLMIVNVNYRRFSVYMYMLAKFTMRWLFYRTAAYLCKAGNCGSVCEVVNPGKGHKRRAVARRHCIDPERFERL
ncbi:hypothetical protein LOCC1_G007975 [Lachnellula occidentalis]|uniref:Uncharacterized protein n=1 Tax=Lachnellula occidentalis TaxID=215460 RepID=A0A8H8RKJ9_9HELO|nr:hypothetical protein LOCC1_G007975 [Lachnellula occidentalis]